MAKVSFDGTSRLIQVDAGVTSLDVGVDLYGDWKEWVLLPGNAGYAPAFRTVGGDPTTAGKTLGATFFLINGWRIRPDETDHRLIVAGNLYTEEGDNPFLSTLGPYTVTIVSEVSNLVDSISVLVDRAMTLSPELIFVNGRPYLKISDPDLYG